MCFTSSLFVKPGAASLALIEADLVVLLGNRISLLYAFGDIINPNAKIVQVDIEAEEIGRNRSVDLGVLSDIKAFIVECNHQFENEDDTPPPSQRFLSWRQALEKEIEKQAAEAEVNWSGADDCIHPWRLAKKIDLFMNRDDDIVAADGEICRYG